MVETVINYTTEYRTDERGKRLRFRWDAGANDFARDARGELIPDRRGRPYRQWRDEIRSPDDIWSEIVEAAQLPGTTSAPELQPIAARIVMLQSGMRAPMGVKVRGPDLETIERVSLEIERLLKEAPGVNPPTVIADRIVGKPYLEIDIDRTAIARYGLHIRDVQDVIEVAIGGRPITQTVEGRERYVVRVRYLRELRDTVESLGEIIVPAATGAQIPLRQLAEIRYVRGPQVIKSEDTFLVGYVVFDKKRGEAEVDVVTRARDHLDAAVASGELEVPRGVSWIFAGSYENQVRSEQRLRVILPVALFVILLILYLQFHRISTTLLVFTGILVAWAGRIPDDLALRPAVVPRRLRVRHEPARPFRGPSDQPERRGVGRVPRAVRDRDGHRGDPRDVPAAGLRGAATRDPRGGHGGHRGASLLRVRPCLMTTATTILALLPVLTSTGRGADVMIPMAIPSFGGMTVQILTMLVVPTIWAWMHERSTK